MDDTTVIPTAIPDVTGLQLGKIPPAATAGVLDRLLPGADEKRVPVAAFNSSI